MLAAAHQKHFILIKTINRIFLLRHSHLDYGMCAMNDLHSSQRVCKKNTREWIRKHLDALSLPLVTSVTSVMKSLHTFMHFINTTSHSLASITCFYSNWNKCILSNWANKFNKFAGVTHGMVALSLGSAVSVIIDIRNECSSFLLLSFLMIDILFLSHKRNRRLLAKPFSLSLPPQINDTF